MIINGECLSCECYCIRDYLDGYDVDICPICQDVVQYQPDPLVDQWIEDLIYALSY